MFFSKKDNSLIAKYGNETVLIEPWGKNALRVRATLYPTFSGEDKALMPAPKYNTKIEIRENSAEITNGKITAFFHKNGWLEFYRGEKLILKEYYRDFSFANEHSPCMRVVAREYKPLVGGDYALTLRFDASDEKIFGMGQYQQPNFNLKGCVLELAQRNSQVSVPFYLSSLGYGFLWNSEGIGEAVFGSNFTRFTSLSGKEFDYWITADDTPKKIIENYTEVVGRAPEFPENALGLWQSKLRYRTQDEVLSVAREYHRRGVPLDVIVIDFFHWIRQGDWAFDPEYWPDPIGMTKELHEMGTQCMVSIWPTVDKKSVNFEPMQERGLLIRTERGSNQCFDFQGDTVI